MEVFRDFHRRTLRPFLDHVTRCRVFRVPADQALPDWLQSRREAKWERVGARPAEWCAAYIKQHGKEDRLLLTPEVFDDELFWWWAVTQPPSIGIVYFVPLADFDWVAFFKHSYDPQQIGGSQPSILRDAKQETRRNAMVAFLLSNELSARVVASAPNVELLFRLAVEHAVPTRYLGVV